MQLLGSPYTPTNTLPISGEHPLQKIKHCKGKGLSYTVALNSKTSSDKLKWDSRKQIKYLQQFAVDPYISVLS
jgi:hypothetical protein